MKIEDFNANVFEKFNKEWALLSAGDVSKFNTMTISWGSFGTLWNKPVVTVYVRKSRYTYEFLENNEYFTVSFYSDKYKKDLGILGTISGKNKDKVALTKLNVKQINDTITFKEATTTIICKKIYSDDINMNNVPSDIKNNLYKDNDYHSMFIGEVIKIISEDD